MCSNHFYIGSLNTSKPCEEQRQAHMATKILEMSNIQLLLKKEI